MLLLGGVNRNAEDLDALELKGEELREAMRFASQSGSLGATLGRGGMTFEFPETDVLEGRFTLGKLVGGGDIAGELLLCSKVRSKL